MLKLEKVARDNQINVIFRDKNHLLTRPFLTALAIALGIHLLIVIVFHISPIKIRWTNTTVIPSLVEIDPASSRQQGSIVAASTGTGVQPRHLFLEPKPASPAIPPLPVYLPGRQIDFAQQQNILVNPFSLIEQEIYRPSFPPAAYIRPHQPILVVIAGPLSRKKILNNGLSEATLAALPRTSTPQRAVYSVLVDEQTGHIFWMEQKQKIDSKTLERIADKILKDLEFSKEHGTFVTSGEIELHFNPNPDEGPL